MYLDDKRESTNLEDRPASGDGLPIVGKGSVAIVPVTNCFSVNLLVVLSIGQRFQQSARVEPQFILTNDHNVKFVMKVLANTEDTWGKQFEASEQKIYGTKTYVIQRANTYSMRLWSSSNESMVTRSLAH